MRSVLIALMLIMVGSGNPRTQEKSKSAAAVSAQKAVSLQVVLSRYDGDKKMSSMPYTLLVTVGDEARLNMGVQIPLQVTANNSVTVAFKDAGTTVVCKTTQDAEEGRLFVDLRVEQSGLYLPEGSKGASDRISIGPNPMLRSFNANFRFHIRDGETKQLTSATDPVNGNVLKVDVTANVVK